MDKIDWKKDHILWMRNEIPEGFETPEPKKLRQEIEPWLTALFQSEHLSLFAGAGLAYSAHYLAASEDCSGMAGKDFTVFAKEIDAGSKESAKAAPTALKPQRRLVS